MDIEIEFTQGPISIPPRPFSSRETGAAVEFHGIVREKEGDSRLEGLGYEAYEPMARSEFGRICTALEREHPVQAALIIHRLGFVPVGEASLYVRIESKHRGPALAFCGALIDRMKEEVPIWKLPRHRAAGSQPE
jgi:molybdopterin synthase catalytic subunit